MELKKAIEYVNKQLEALERQIFYFETVAKPRYEQDTKILADLKRQAIKMDALLQKSQSGQEITSEEVYDAVPAVFR